MDNRGFLFNLRDLGHGVSLRTNTSNGANPDLPP